MAQNIFKDFYKDPVDYNMKHLKSTLIMVLVGVIRTKGWTQKEAAKALDISQPRMSNLFKGHLHKFSVDNLIELLVRIGYSVEVAFDPKNEAKPLQMTLGKVD